jgi:ribonuclease HII
MITLACCQWVVIFSTLVQFPHSETTSMTQTTKRKNSKKEERLDWLQEERLAAEEGYLCVVGVDEAGRGCLAGPVVAACVSLPCDWVPPGVNDSKQLTPHQREEVFACLQRRARGIGIGIVPAEEIDRINILQAAHQAMREAVMAMPAGLFPDLALIDGYPVRPFPLDQLALVRGDSISASIASASIVAKVTRDRLMVEMDALYPEYGFRIHKGYGVAAHLRALAQYGPCPLHRRTFRPVAELTRSS